jgi:PAS domain-containing protein
MILVTLYAGWRWGLAPVAAGLIFAGWLFGAFQGEAMNRSQIATLVLFVVSSLITTAVAAGLRASMIKLAEARRRQSEAEARLQVTQTSAGVGPWEWDVRNNVLDLSPTARRNLGLPLEGPVDLDRTWPSWSTPTTAPWSGASCARR